MSAPQVHQETAGGRTTLHHIAFTVPDVDASMAFWAETFGVGPFVRMVDRSDPDAIVYRAAFCSWGTAFVELLPGGADHADVQGRLDHVSYLTAEPAAESERLAARGLPKLREMQRGEVWTQHHEAPPLGCNIEVHRASGSLDHFFAMIKDTVEGWDGAELVRLVDEPGTAPPG